MPQASGPSYHSLITVIDYPKLKLLSWAVWGNFQLKKTHPSCKKQANFRVPTAKREEDAMGPRVLMKGFQEPHSAIPPYNQIRSFVLKKHHFFRVSWSSSYSLHLFFPQPEFGMLKFPRLQKGIPTQPEPKNPPLARTAPIASWMMLQRVAKKRRENTRPGTWAVRTLMVKRTSGKVTSWGW